MEVENREINRNKLEKEFIFILIGSLLGSCEIFTKLEGGNIIYYLGIKYFTNKDNSTQNINYLFFSHKYPHFFLQLFETFCAHLLMCTKSFK